MAELLEMSSLATDAIGSISESASTAETSFSNSASVSPDTFFNKDPSNLISNPVPSSSSTSPSLSSTSAIPTGSSLNPEATSFSPRGTTAPSYPNFVSGGMLDKSLNTSANSSSPTMMDGVRSMWNTSNGVSTGKSSNSNFNSGLLNVLMGPRLSLSPTVNFGSQQRQSQTVGIGSQNK